MNTVFRLPHPVLDRTMLIFKVTVLIKRAKYELNTVFHSSLRIFNMFVLLPGVWMRSFSGARGEPLPGTQCASVVLLDTPGLGGAAGPAGSLRATHDALTIALLASSTVRHPFTHSNAHLTFWCVVLVVCLCV